MLSRDGYTVRQAGYARSFVTIGRSNQVELNRLPSRVPMPGTGMKLVQNADKQTFTATELSFGEVKAIRDALKAFAKGGSAQAAKLAGEIEAALDNMQV